MIAKQYIPWVTLVFTIIGAAYWLGTTRIDSKNLSLVEENLALKNQINYKDSITSLLSSIAKKDEMILDLNQSILKRDSIENMNVNTATDFSSWQGKWIQSIALTTGEMTGKMFLFIDGNNIIGACDNHLGGVTTINEGHMSGSGNVIGDWKNLSNGQFGTFEFSINGNHSFTGNYAMKDQPIEYHKNKWSGVKVESTATEIMKFGKKIGGYDYQLASLFYDQALSLNQNYTTALIYKGYANFKLARHKVGEEALLKAIQIEPRSSWAHYNLGKIYWAMSKSDKAITEIKIAISFLPKEIKSQLKADIAVGEFEGEPNNLKKLNQLAR